jgi:hypothetical protein
MRSAAPACWTIQSSARMTSIRYDGPIGGVYSNSSIFDDSEAGNATIRWRCSSGRSGSVFGVPKLVPMNSTWSRISLNICTERCGL